jgi:hypothetical protein
MIRSTVLAAILLSTSAIVPAASTPSAISMRQTRAGQEDTVHANSNHGIARPISIGSGNAVAGAPAMRISVWERFVEWMLAIL